MLTEVALQCDTIEDDERAADYIEQARKYIMEEHAWDVLACCRYFEGRLLVRQREIVVMS